MMSIAHQRGSREFFRPLRKLGVPCKISTKLRFADFAFTGHGPQGPARVGVERKRVSEIADEIAYKRFKGHQLPGLIDHYDFVYVVVEGDVKPDPRSGLLMAGRWEFGFGGERIMYETYQKRLCTLYTKIGIHVWLTKSQMETRHYLHALYRWWDKPWKAHKSAYQVDEQRTDTAILDMRTMDRQTYAQWPGIGWTRSRWVADHFACVLDAARATAEEWAELRYKDVNGKWHRFGPGRAQTVREFLHGTTSKQTAKA